MRQPAYLSGIGLPTAVWISFVLAVTLPRSLPDQPGFETLLFQGLGVIGAALVVLNNRARRGDAAVLVVFCLVPATAIVLALSRKQLGDTVNWLASLLALIAAFQLDRDVRLRSAMRALLVLVVASLTIGVVYAPAVLRNQRAFLGVVYRGRLFGLLQTPNVLGECSALLIALALLALRGRMRLIVIAIGYLAILAASSQTALIAATLTVLGYLAVVAWRRGAAHLVLAGYCAALVVVLAGVFYVANSPARLGQLAASLTLSDRTSIWYVLLQRNIPFTGLGQTALSAIFAGSNIRGATGVSSAHDAWLDAYLRDGVPGVVAISAVVVLTFGLIIGRRGGLALVPLVTFLVESITEVTPTHVPFYAFYFIAISACVEIERRVVAPPVQMRAGVGAVPPESGSIAVF